jgi:hypothetical protein
MANMTAVFFVGVLVPSGHMDGATVERWARNTPLAYLRAGDEFFGELFRGYGVMGAWWAVRVGMQSEKILRGGRQN